MTYKVILTRNAIENIEDFNRAGHKRLLKKLDSLLEELKLHPKTGTGKPELLKHYSIPT